MPFPDFVVPTTAIEAKELPAPPQDQFPLPKDSNATLLAILVVFATLTAAYVASDVILPILLAVIMKFLLQPIMRLMSKAKIPTVISALVLIIAAFLSIIGIMAVLSRPAASWVEAVPERLPQIEKKLQFVETPASRISSFLARLDPGDTLQKRVHSELAVSDWPPRSFEERSTSRLNCSRLCLFCSFSSSREIFFCGASLR